MVRVSSTDQNGGAGTQAAAIEEWVATRGDVYVACFTDMVQGTMEHLGERRAIAAAMEAIAAGAADGLVVWKLDRLARDLALQELLIMETRAQGGQVASVQPEEQRLLEGAEEDATRTLIRHILGAVAQYERAGIRLRVAAGRARARKEGRWLGGMPAYGKRIVDGRSVNNPREMRILGESLTLQALGVPNEEIGAFWLASGMPPRRLTVRVHARETVRGVLLKAQAAGVSGLPLGPLGREFAGSRALLLSTDQT